MDKIWLNSYPPNVPAEIDPDQYRSLVHLLQESFSKYADRKAYVCMDKFLTFGELDAYSKQLAGWLQSRGMQPGARVAVMMPNVLQYPIAIAAVLRAGYTVVNVNPLYTPRELEHQINDSGSEAIMSYKPTESWAMASCSSFSSLCSGKISGRSTRGSFLR